MKRISREETQTIYSRSRLSLLLTESRDHLTGADTRPARAREYRLFSTLSDCEGGVQTLVNVSSRPTAPSFTETVRILSFHPEDVWLEGEKEENVGLGGEKEENVRLGGERRRRINQSNIGTNTKVITQ